MPMDLKRDFVAKEVLVAHSTTIRAMCLKRLGKYDGKAPLFSAFTVQHDLKDGERSKGMAKKTTKLHIGWVIVERTNVGTWKAIIDTTDETKTATIAHYMWSLGYYKRNGRWTKLLRSGKAKAIKIYGTI